MEGIRLNRYLSEMGICSRREADRLIEAGRVLIDGRRANLGDRVTEDRQVLCDGKPVGGAAGRAEPDRQVLCDGKPVGDAADRAEPDRQEPGKPAGTGRPKPVLLAVNKPRGIVCTTSTKDRAPNIVEMVHYPQRVYPAGRLDKDSQGLIFMTNQGDLVNRLMRGSGGHEKEYAVAVNRPVTRAFLARMEAGLWLEELQTRTRPCRAWATGKREFHIVLTQGLNRQIRRMCAALGYQVRNLCRVRIMNIRLGNLKEGTFRKVTPEEYAELMRLLDEESEAGKEAAERKRNPDRGKDPGKGENR